MSFGVIGVPSVLSHGPHFAKDTRINGPIRLTFHFAFQVELWRGVDLVAAVEALEMGVKHISYNNVPRLGGLLCIVVVFG